MLRRFRHVATTSTTTAARLPTQLTATATSTTTTLRQQSGSAPTQHQYVDPAYLDSQGDFDPGSITRDPDDGADEYYFRKGSVHSPATMRRDHAPIGRDADDDDGGVELDYSGATMTGDFSRVADFDGGDGDEDRIEDDGKYRPRVRPRKLVMPVDPDDLHSDRRLGEDERYLRSADDLRREATSHSALKLGVVPADRTFAELFGEVLRFVNKERAAAENAKKKKKKKKKSSDDDVENVSSASVGATISPTTMSDFLTVASSTDSNDAVSARAYQTYDTLAQVPLNSQDRGGGIGPLAESGRALLELEVAAFAFSTYPRMRSAHVDRLVEALCGPQAIAKLARSIGLARLCGVETDARLWNELMNLHQRELEISHAHKIQRQRVAARVPSQNLWQTRQQLRQLRRAVRQFPTDAATLLPRIEWLRNVTFAFLGWLELAEGEAAARRFVAHYVCDEHLRVADVDVDAEDPDDVNDPDKHPLNLRALRRAHRFQTTAHLHGAESHDNIFARHSGAELADLATRRVVDAVSPDNALKEAQILLNYSPFAPADDEIVLVEKRGQSRGAKQQQRRIVKFDIEIKTQAQPILDAGSKNLLDPERQDFMTPKVLEANFVVWRKKEKKEKEHGAAAAAEKATLGKGIGQTEQDAMQAAALDFVRRYYFAS